MDEFLQPVRYYLALLTLTIAPSIVLYWTLIHTFVEFWRRLGHRRTFAIVLPLLIASAIGLFMIRATLLAVDFGTNYYLIALAFSSYVGARLISVKRLK